MLAPTGCGFRLNVVANVRRALNLQHRRCSLIASEKLWTPASLPPGRERFREGALARGALFERQDGAAVVVVDDRDVEPGPLLEQLQIAVAVGVGGGQADQEEAVGDLDGEPGERHAARLLGR